jgi:hypothetical protein
MRTAVFLIALSFIIIGITGLVSPAGLIAIRHQIADAGLYAAIAVRVAIGLVLILFAPASRAPKTLRVLGAISCVQGLTALVGLERVRAIQDLEAVHTTLLRAGAVVAVATGGFLAFAATEPLPAANPD